MITGTVILEDTSVTFSCVKGESIFTVTDLPTEESETFTVPQDKFFKALAIAVHNDGEPDYKVDYPDAESIMGKIRWIP